MLGSDSELDFDGLEIAQIYNLKNTKTCDCDNLRKFAFIFIFISLKKLHYACL